MSDVRKLLDEATPLPWFRQGTLINGPDKGGIDIGPLLMDVYSERDSALIVRAVNRLPDYETAVDALAGLSDAVANMVEDRYLKDDADPLGRRYQAARAVLARLREPVPA